jgi:hypothetical protein
VVLEAQDLADDFDYLGIPVIQAKREEGNGHAEQAAAHAEVHDEVGRLVPPVLRRWDTEPLVNRLLLGALAATYPLHGAAVGEEIAATARDSGGTQAEAFLQLAGLLIRGEPGRAIEAATRIATWADGIRYAALDDQTIDPGIRALHVLSDTVYACAQASRRAA